MTTKRAPKLSPDAQAVAYSHLWAKLLTVPKPQVAVKSDPKENPNDLNH